jgi:uroporphyrinogen-III synthase
VTSLPDAARGDLTGIGVVVTRPREQADALVGYLHGRGATVVCLPLTRIDGRTSAWTEAERDSLARADIVAVTSVNGARELVRQLASNDVDLPSGVCIAAVGDETGAALRTLGICADIVPSQATAVAMVAALADRGPLDGRRAVLARARLGRPELADGLAAHGVVVSELPLYDTVICDPDTAALPAALGCQIWTFLAPSSVDAAVAAVGVSHLAAQLAVSIGPTTSAHLRSLQIPVAAEASVRSAAGMTDAVVAAGRALRPPATSV